MNPVPTRLQRRHRSSPPSIIAANAVSNSSAVLTRTGAARPSNSVPPLRGLAWPGPFASRAGPTALRLAARRAPLPSETQALCPRTQQARCSNRSCSPLAVRGWRRCLRRRGPNCSRRRWGSCCLLAGAAEHNRSSRPRRDRGRAERVRRHTPPQPDRPVPAPSGTPR